MIRFRGWRAFPRICFAYQFEGSIKLLARFRTVMNYWNIQIFKKILYCSPRIRNHLHELKNHYLAATFSLDLTVCHPLPQPFEYLTELQRHSARCSRVSW